MYSDVISNASRAHEDNIKNIMIDVNLESRDKAVATKLSPKK